MDTPAPDAANGRERRPVRLGLLGPAGSAREALRDGLAVHGIQVVLETVLGAYLARGSSERLDALLVDLHDASDADLDCLPDLMDRPDLPPVVFNEAPAEGARRVWMQRLAAKIAELAVPGPASDVGAEPAVATPTLQSDPMVWVLGSSFGGPEAVKRFLDAAPSAPNAILFLAQHIGTGFADVLAAQLHRSTAFAVSAMREGEQPRPGHLYVAPVNARVRIAATGELELKPDDLPERIHRPCIDTLLEEVARAYGPRSGALIFSGMGKDGAEGARAIAAAGGEVWAQDAESSTVSNMPEAAVATGVVTRRGTPEELAAALVQYLRPAGAGAPATRT